MTARIVIAGTASGVGKTTVTIGLARALRARGLRVALFKCGPDYLDPSYHARAAGTVSHNLDGFLMARDGVLATFARASRAADIALIEGVMGLFDGASATSDEGSSAEVAKWLQAPVLLVCDASGMARSVAAIAQGFAGFDPAVQLAGLICNRVGSRGHLELLREASAAVAAVPVVGGFPKEPSLVFPERHLGLRTADEDAVPEPLFDAWGERAEAWLDLNAILALARAAPTLPAHPIATVARAAAICRIGIAYDEAFHFYYDDNLRRLEQLGAELVRFSPLRDRELPRVAGLYLGGGYPELHVQALSGNQGLRAAIARFAAGGGPVYAECGGLMYLARSLRTLDGCEHPMVGVIPGTSVMHERLQALGYVEVETKTPTLLGPAGLCFRGHEFRYSELQLEAAVDCAYRVRRRRGGALTAEGYWLGNTLASYVHAHWASNGAIPAALVGACAVYSARDRR